MELQNSLLPGVSLSLDNYMLVLLAIMVLAGMLGGAANYFVSDKSGSSAKELSKYTVLGVVAALTVPLFLNMISSDLLATAKSRPIDLFVFAGFCLLFVLFSRRFVESAAAKLLQQLSHLRD